jgi:oligopeptidase A
MHLPRFSKLQPHSVLSQLTQLIELFKQQISTHLSLETSPSAEKILKILNEQGEELEQFWSPCAHLNAVIGSPEWRECYSQCLPLLNDYDTFIHQNLSLYQALKSADIQSLSATEKKLRDDFLLNCELSGINLDDSNRQRVEKIFARLDELAQEFDNHVIDSQKMFKYHTLLEKELIGIPEHVLSNAKKRAEEDKLEGWLFHLDQPTYLAIVTYAVDVQIRKRFFKAYNSRASELNPSFDNTPIIQEILALRQELAHLVGLEDYVAYSLSHKMAKSKSRVLQFLQRLLDVVVPIAKKDMEMVQQFAKKQGFEGKLEPWDIPYVVQLRQKALFALDQEALRPYFPLQHVMQSINELLMSLYQIKLEKIPDIEVWHPSVEFYHVKQGDTVLGGLYCDWFSREGKRGGAWMDTLQTHTHRHKPIATLTCNFANPAPGKVPCLTHDELTTLLHELGHCLHHLLSEVKEFSASGVHGVEWDAVELPSQWMENWGWQKHWVKRFSQHVETGDSLPEQDFEQLLAIKNDLIGLYLLRQLIFARYDLDIHTQLPPKDAIEVQQQYFELLETYAVWPIDRDLRFPQAFGHIFGGGYAAGYYSYLWADVLSCDVFDWFESRPEQLTLCGQAFRNKILAKGGSISALDAFIDLMGREPSEQALLRSYGLIS